MNSPVNQVQFLNSDIVVSGEQGGKTRFWNVKDGTEAQASVAGGKFTFTKDTSENQQVGRHVITTHDDLVLVHAIDGTEDGTDSAPVKDLAPVAFFHATGPINVIECAGGHIVVGCENGDVLHLRASFLMQDDWSRP